MSNHRVIVASILRFLTLGDAGKAADHTYGPLISTTWTTIEANTAIVCVCVPTLKTLVVKMFQGVFGKTETETRRSSSYGRHNYSFDPESPREHQYTELQVLSKTNRSIRIPISPTTKASIRSEGIMLGNRLSIVKEFGNGSDLRRSADRDDGLNVWTLDAGHGRTKRYGDNSKRSCTGTAKSNVKIKTLDTGQCPTNGLKNKQVITNMEISLGPEANSVETSRDKKEGVNHKSNETCADLETGRTCKAYRGSIEERIGFREMLAAANGIERNAFI
ncbi:hypothetical protein MMC14_004628 [Varicellaria rhodocarpa]|nr:hypothetical protein [Varicellaria rhodocarpa]